MIALKEIYRPTEFRKDFVPAAGASDQKRLADVLAIIQKVRKEGDRALKEYTEKFDGQKLDQLKVPEKFLEESYRALDSELRESLEFAKSRIIAYEKQVKYQDKDLGSFRYVYRPLNRVGFYVPGGQALYPSTVLMSILAAQVAGVDEIYAVTPTFSDQNVTFASLYICGVKNVYRVGGAQAVAGLAYGTETLPKVDKIVGPGNSYVAMAKRLVFGDVGIDSIAGPSEILVYIDETADPEAVVLDLFAQAEHDPEAKTFLLAENRELLIKVRKLALDRYRDQARSEIIGRSLENNHYSVSGARPDLIDLINYIAPEHLSIQHRAEEEIAGGVKYAGAVFIGRFSPEAIGDYVAGPSHVLPTSGSARFSHGLNVNDFMTSHAEIRMDQETFRKIAQPAAILAESEGLYAHAASLTSRLDKILEKK